MRPSDKRWLLPSFTIFVSIVEANWDVWWNYDGISGPDYWGILNPDWKLCNQGRRQSPINIDPHKLIFDPNLKSLRIDKSRISGDLENDGRTIIFRATEPEDSVVTFEGGPLAYRYQFEEMYIRFGKENSRGSEHTLGGRTFPLELQFFAFNSDLYANLSEAIQQRQGTAIVAISVLFKVGDVVNEEFDMIAEGLQYIMYSGTFLENGQTTTVKYISLRELIPSSQSYITYEGSLTFPSCLESVRWIILNKPGYITTQQLLKLRGLVQGSKNKVGVSLGDNFRSPQPLNHRAIWTNIRPPVVNQCKHSGPIVIYKVNPVHPHPIQEIMPEMEVEVGEELLIDDVISGLENQLRNLSAVAPTL